MFLLIASLRWVSSCAFGNLCATYMRLLRVKVSIVDDSSGVDLPKSREQKRRQAI